MNERQTVGLTFANYNYAFNSFYEQYKKLCLEISEIKEIEGLKIIAKKISTFVYENEYTINDLEKRNTYNQRLIRLKIKAEQDLDLKKILSKDLGYTTNKVEYKQIYYKYLLDYLLVLGDYVSELSVTFMPNTNLQRKLLKFANNQGFFEKFTQHKEKVLESLSNFEIKHFTESYNKLLTFYFAYSLFINEQDKVILIKMFSYTLSYYVSSETLQIVTKEDPSQDQKIKISKIESSMHRALLFCLSTMNQSFSNYDVLPKIQNKVYIDKTLI